MAGAELIGKEELKEIEVLFETGIFARYSLDKERQGIWKVRDFEKAFTQYFGSRYALGVSSGSCCPQDRPHGPRRRARRRGDLSRLHVHGHL